LYQTQLMTLETSFHRMNKDKKILVTGGTGYVGSHVARAFKKEGYTVGVIDCVYREYALDDIETYCIDDYSSDRALGYMINFAPNIIVHCAGCAVVRPSMTNPSEYWNNNVAKNVKFLDVVRDLPTKPLIIFSSSCSVYGLPKELPITEESEVNPISPYGNTKVTFEKMLHDYYVAYGVSSVSFRYFNAAGAEPFKFNLGQEPGAPHIMARVLESCITKTDFYLLGNNYNTEDGTGVRDYIHVWDLAMAHVKVVEQYNGPMLEVYNLGSGKGISNKEVIEYVQEKYGNFNVIVVEPNPGDPDKLYAHSNKFQSQYDWTMPLTNIDDIVNSAYKWYKKIL
jgi:UDP-glucose 4-epimerase